jgi:hypothetical protein
MNGMKILLISDPETDKAAAAMDVHIGEQRISTVWYLAVLRILEVYPGSDFFLSRIPDSNFFHSGSRIRINKFRYFLTPKMVSKL